MNKTIMMICSLALSTTFFANVAYASQTIKNETKGNSEITQLQEAVEIMYYEADIMLLRTKMN